MERYIALQHDTYSGCFDIIVDKKKTNSQEWNKSENHNRPNAPFFHAEYSEPKLDIAFAMPFTMFHLVSKAGPTCKKTAFRRLLFASIPRAVSWPIQSKTMWPLSVVEPRNRQGTHSSVSSGGQGRRECHIYASQCDAGLLGGAMTIHNDKHLPCYFGPVSQH